MTVCLPHVDLKKDYRVYQVPLSLITACVLMSISVEAEEIDLSGFDDEPVAVSQEATRADDALMDGFDDTPVVTTEEKKSTQDKILDGFEDTPSASTEIEDGKSDILPGLTGKLTEQIAYSLYDDRPHDNISSLKS